MHKSIKLALASVLVGAIGMASIPASYASSVSTSGHKTTVNAAGHSTLIAKGKKKMKKVKRSSMMKRR